MTPPSWITTAQSLTGLRRRSVYTGSARAEHTVTDGLGRTVAVWGSGRGEYHAYDSAGRLSAVHYDPAVVSSANTKRRPLLYAYDNLGRVVKTGYSLDDANPDTTPGTLDASSASDRISVTAYSIVQFGGAGPWWNKTERQFYTNATGTLATASTSLDLLTADSATGLLSETRAISPDGTEQRTRVTVNTTTKERRTTTSAYINSTGAAAYTNTAVTIHKNGILYSANTPSVQPP